MSFGFGFGLPSWQALSGGFTPASLFSANEQGAWYDPSDFSTLFTDSAGTTPVTGVEQFVGLMLDKSKGAPTTLGAELKTNGTIATIGAPGTLATYNTTTGAGTAYRLDSTNVSAVLFDVVPDKTYKIDIEQVTGTLQIRGTAPNGTQLFTSVIGRQTILLYVPVGSELYFVTGTNASSVSFTVHSVRELPGNHATSTGTKRPKLAARYNLLTYSEQFDNAAWTKQTNVTITANSAVAPDGNATADTLASSSATTQNGLYLLATGANSTAYTASIYVKAGTAATLQFGLTTQSELNTAYYNFDLTAVTATAASSGFTSQSASIALVGNGWYRCTVSGTTPASGVTNIGVFARLFAAANVLIWGADLRPSSQATGLIGPTYQRVVDAATYDTVGFLPYLAFDGVDDSMSTGSIDFTATDKMTVFAGVRKLSDAATSFIAEFSSAWDGGNNGTFAIGLISSSSNYFTALNGTSAAYYTETTFGAPITNVLTSSYNIAGASIASEIIPRVNGSTPTLAAVGTTSGTGNFGNYPLFICARNNASLYFNGWLSSLIIRGAQSTDSQISATESWVNGRTGAY
jgi:hypothetical protein